MNNLVRLLCVFLLAPAFFASAYSPMTVLVDATDPAKYDVNDGNVALTNTGPQYTVIWRNPGVTVQANVTTDPNGVWSTKVLHDISCTNGDDAFYNLDANFSAASCTATGYNTGNPHYSKGANSSSGTGDDTSGIGNVVLWMRSNQPLNAGLYGGQHLLYKQRYCLEQTNCSTTSFDAKNAEGNYLVQGEVDVWLNYSIVIPTSCTINAGTVFKVDLPAVSAGEMKASGIGGTPSGFTSDVKSIPIQCTGGGATSANIQLRLGGPSPVGMTSALLSDIPGVGVAVRDENPSSSNYGQDLKPNTTDSYVSLSTDNNGNSQALLSFRPVYTGGDIYPGNYAANGILVANIP